MAMLALVAAPLIRLALRAIHLLPWWEKVAAKRSHERGAELAIIQIGWTAP